MKKKWPQTNERTKSHYKNVKCEKAKKEKKIVKSSFITYVKLIHVENNFSCLPFKNVLRQIIENGLSCL